MEVCLPVVDMMHRIHRVVAMVEILVVVADHRVIMQLLAKAVMVVLLLNLFSELGTEHDF
jgi:hypothetical protein